MDLKPVKSSVIKSIGHDGKNLRVQFHNGAVHEFSGVPAATYSAMLASGSMGRFFGSKIRNQFPSQKVSG